MNHLKLFEEFKYSFKNSYYENRYKEHLDKINNAKIGDILSNYDIYMYVEYLTERAGKYEECFGEGDLGDRLNEYDKYILKKIKISDIDLEEWQIDEDDIELYKDMYLTNKDYPPIVVDKNLSIIDGTHRANAIFNVGEKTILAFVGI
jgi:hypothetical protein